MILQILSPSTKFLAFNYKKEHYNSVLNFDKHWWNIDEPYGRFVETWYLIIAIASRLFVVVYLKLCTHLTKRTALTPSESF